MTKETMTQEEMTASRVTPLPILLFIYLIDIIFIEKVKMYLDKYHVIIYLDCRFILSYDSKEKVVHSVTKV